LVGAPSERTLESARLWGKLKLELHTVGKLKLELHTVGKLKLELHTVGMAVVWALLSVDGGWAGGHPGRAGKFRLTRLGFQGRLKNDLSR